jgi:cytoskeletal protein CcmA (bactofilin family)
MANGFRFMAACAVILAFSGCDISFDGDDSNKVNGSVHVPVGKAPDDARTVNGSIRVDDNATVNSAATVNGSIHLGDHAAATSLKTVNGSISIGAGAHDSGGAGSVNHDPALNMGCAHDEGGIVVEKTSGLSFDNKEPVIIIGPGATVQGELRFERPVKLYVSDKATIGTVTGATPVPFTGDTPPK